MKSAIQTILIVLLMLAISCISCSEKGHIDAKIRVIGEQYDSGIVYVLNDVSPILKVGDTITRGYQKCVVDEIYKNDVLIASNPKNLWEISKDYQIELLPDSMKIWDMNRLITTMSLDNPTLTQDLVNILYKQNE